MKKQNFIFLFLFIFSSICIDGQEINRIIVKLKDTNEGLSDARKVSRVNKLFSSHKIQEIILSKKNNKTIYTVDFPEGTDIQKVIQEYYKTGEIEYAEPDYPVYIHGESQLTTPTDQYYTRQWGLNNDGSFSVLTSIAGADIDMEKAWDIEQGDESIIVAVIDTGAKVDHPDLSSRIWVNSGETAGNSIDDDGNGYIDDINGWNFADNNNDLTDIYGHGTNVAGIIGAASNNSIGYTGVDWNCKLMILRVFSSTGGGTTATVASAIDYAVDNGAKVINLSLGSTTASTTLQNSVTNALQNNVVIVASMGNDNSEQTNYPAGFTGVIAVGATNPNDNRSQPFYGNSTGGSNYGDHISVVAPGNAIYGLYTTDTNYSVLWSGTSQAAPHVAGLSSLLLAQNSSRTPSDVKSIIEETAEDQVGSSTEDVAGWDKYYGYGRINAYLALSKSLSIDNPSYNSSNISVFPNPAKQDFTCNFTSDTEQINIFNSIGQLINSKIIKNTLNENFHINEPGVYFIQFTSKNGKKVTKKIIISK